MVKNMGIPIPSLVPFLPLFFLLLIRLICIILFRMFIDRMFVLISCRFLARTHLNRGRDSLFHLSHIESFGHDALKYGKELGISRFKCVQSESKKEVECAVCLCKIEEGEEIRELRCEHLFHRICLDRWIGYRHSTCPLCRGSLTPRLGLKPEDEEELMFKFSSFSRSNARTRQWLR